ncbi:MAG: hypothetical protein ACRC9K_17415 [Afipia sp.]
MKIRILISISCILSCGIMVAGCFGAPHVPGVGMVASAAGMGSPYSPLTNAVAMTNASVVGPQEQMQYASKSCPELKSYIDRFKTSSAAFSQATSVKHGADKKAIAMQAMTTRLDYLKTLYATKKC